MKKLLLSAAIATIFTGNLAFAEDAKPDNEVSFNIAGVTDYRYRGLSQTRLKPALQGGADYVNNPSGFYAGTWLSTIKWTKDAGAVAISKSICMPVKKAKSSKMFLTMLVCSVMCTHRMTWAKWLVC